MAESMGPRELPAKSSDESESKVSTAGVSSHISELPTELITMILQEACRSYADYDSDLIADPKKRLLSPFFIGKICRLWREIVWKTPVFWSFIELVLDLSKGNLATDLELLEGWIDRSGTMPLSIALRGRKTYNEFKDVNSNPPHEFFSLLATLSPRWYSLDIFVPEQCVPDLAVVVGHTPNLVSLKVRPPGGKYWRGLGSIMRLFQQSPQLRQVRVESLAIPLGGWLQLKHLELVDHPIYEAFNFLLSLSEVQVTSLIIHGVYAYRGWDTASPRATLPFLEDLKIQFDDEADMYYMLNALRLPALKSLEATFASTIDRSDFHFPFSRLTSLISRSSCPLQKLSIWNTTITPSAEDEVIECLRSTPSLVEFTLSLHPGARTKLAGEILEALGPQIPEGAALSEPFLPALRVFRYYGHSPISGFDLLDALEYRWSMGLGDDIESIDGGIEKLTCFEMGSKSTLQHEEWELDGLRSLVADGMNLRLHFSNVCIRSASREG